MPCYHPISGFRAPGGTIKFSRSGAYSDLPVTISCGQCVGCRLERSRQWAVRCIHESQMHESNCFLTLTYDKKSLPSDGSLRVRDWQLFAKQLRNKLTWAHGENKSFPKNFRFFHCGEYGDRNGRPHYHALLFGLDFWLDREHVKTTTNGHKLYFSRTLGKLWPHGKHWLGELTFASAAYVARYILKKGMGNDPWRRYGMALDLVEGSLGTQHASLKFRLNPEYTTMSRNPGIGKTWIDKFMSDVYPHDQVYINGKTCRPPKFYDQQYEISHPESFRALKIQRGIKGYRHNEEQSYWRLDAREEVQQAEIREFTREIE